MVGDSYRDQTQQKDGEAARCCAVQRCRKKTAYTEPDKLTNANISSQKCQKYHKHMEYATNQMKHLFTVEGMLCPIALHYVSIVYII